MVTTVVVVTVAVFGDAAAADDEEVSLVQVVHFLFFSVSLRSFEATVASSLYML